MDNQDKNSNKQWLIVLVVGIILVVVISLIITNNLMWLIRGVRNR